MKNFVCKLITMSFSFYFYFYAVNPLAWAGPDDCPDVQLNRPGLLPAPYFEAPVFDPVHRPAKKQARAPAKDMYSSKPN